MTYRHGITTAILPLVAAERSTLLTGFELVGGDVVNPDLYPPGTSFVWETVLETSNAADSAQVRLYNATTLATIVTLSTASLTPVVLSQTLTSPADLAAGANIYNVLIDLATTGDPNVATITSSHLRVVLP